jgi:hypothetical protein
LDQFNYLTVLVSIILGLGMTQLLTGIGRMLQNRDRVVLYWPAIGSVLNLLIAHVLVWWTLFELRAHAEWTFPGFLSVLLLPILLYLLSALALPDFGDTVADDLRQHYYANSRWFFGLWVLVVAATFLRELVLDGAIDRDLDTAMKLLFMAVFAIAAVTRRPGYHQVMVSASLALMAVYIGMLFTQLPGG